MWFIGHEDYEIEIEYEDFLWKKQVLNGFKKGRTYSDYNDKFTIRMSNIEED